MEYLAVALVLIFVMWLIDKHDVWRKAFKIVAWSVSVVAVLWGVVLGYNRFQQHNERNRKAAYEAAVQQCVKHNMPPNGDVFDEIVLQQDCQKNTSYNPSAVVSHTPISKHNGDPNFSALGDKAAPRIKCYDKNGKLVPDPFAKFGGYQLGCAPGEKEVKQPRSGSSLTAR